MCLSANATKKGLFGLWALFFVIFTILLLSTDVSGQTVWTKYPNNPVMDGTSGGSWDDNNVFYPCIIFDGIEYKMWYSGSTGAGYKIGYAISSDGVTWSKRPTPVLDLGPNGAWDDYQVFDPFVLFDGIMYRMWYTGGHTYGTSLKFGYATSIDGVVWTKNPTPVLLNDGNESLDSGIYMKSVVFDGVQYRMWYVSYYGSKWRIGYATSIDGISWIKHPPYVLEGTAGSWDQSGVLYPEVIFDGEKYRMWYGGQNGPSGKIGYATSIDGISWTKYPSPVLEGTAGSWDSLQVGPPVVIFDGIQYKMWYGGFNVGSGPYKIGYATCIPGPVSPTISSSTHQEGVPINNDDPCFSWTEPASSSGIIGYSYILDQNPNTIPDTITEGSSKSKCYMNVSYGSWYFHVRAQDGDGEWGSTDHYGPVIIETLFQHLVLWNKLGSDQEVTHSMVGENGTIIGTSYAYEPGKFNNGYVRKAKFPENHIQFPASVLHNLKYRGTIELWVDPKVPSPVAFQYGFFGLVGNAAADVTYRGNVYLCWGDEVTGRGLFGGVKFDTQVAETPFEPTQFVATVGVPFHAAICWDINGIDGTSDKVRVYRDGVVVGSTTTSWNPNGTTLEDKFWIGESPDAQGFDKYISDNIKVWNYAKIDFSDRNQESPDNTPPTILSMFPALGATNVPLDVNFSVTFSEPMNQASVLTSMMELKNLDTGETFGPGSLQDLVNSGLATVSFNTLGDVLTITSPIKLSWNTNYQLTINNLLATDLNGNLLNTSTTQATFKTVPLTLSVPTVYGMPGDAVIVPIDINGSVGVSGADIEMSYDSTILTINSITLTPLSSGMNLAVNTSIPDRIVISLASPSGVMTGSGSFVNMNFKIKSDAPHGTNSAITFVTNRVYNELGKIITSGKVNGKVSIPIIGDLNKNGVLQSNDAILAMRFAVRLATPTALDKKIGDIDKDGSIRTNDAILILRLILGLPIQAPGNELWRIGDREYCVMLTDGHLTPDGRIIIPLKIDNIAGLAGGDICIAYDSSILRAIKASSSDGLLVYNMSEPGEILISFASMTGFSSNIISELQFDVLSKGSPSIKFQTVDLYGPDAHLLNSRWIDKELYTILPERTELSQNYPNPFNPDTWIPYQLKDDNDVVIKIYASTGQLVRTLDLGHKIAGFYNSKERSAYWDGKNESGEQITSGIYFYTIQAGKFNSTRKMIILK